MPNVKVYSTSTCHYCVMLKEFLNKNNIQFENIDVGIDRRAAQEMMAGITEGVLNMSTPWPPAASRA